MGEGSAIEWTDHTFNPWVGCEKVSPGCAHCYAETLVTGRMARAGTWGAEGTRQRTSPSTWALPLRWERAAEAFAAEHGRRQRVFCASLADVFEPRPELDEWRVELWDLIGRCPSLDWLILTKRPEVARDWLRDLYDCDHGGAPVASCRYCEPLPNVWVGTSIENARHTYRAEILRTVPAAVRFVSAEPLLGSLFDEPRVETHRPAVDGLPSKRPLDLSGIDWIIVGGESGGRDARPMHPSWAREIRDAVLASRGFPEHAPGPWEPGDGGPAFFFKQWGSYSAADGHADATHLVHEDGRLVTIEQGTSASSRTLRGSEDLVDRGHPGWCRVRYVGASPKSGGARLDRREWREWPRSAAPVPGAGRLFA